MTKFIQVITDYDGNEIIVGTKVRHFDHTSENPADVGEVVEITDWEGDVDDDTGRSITNSPCVVVRYDDLPETIDYATSEWEFTEGGWRAGSDGDPEPGWNHSKGKCEELIVVK